MRRALVIAGVIFAALLAVAPLASAAPTPAAEVEREVTLAFRTEGFTVFFDTTDNDGELSADLAILRGRQKANYSVPVEITAHTVKARFGSLGELDYHYAPQGKKTTGCEDEEGRARFEGTFTFTGENEYVHIDADSAEGVYQFDTPSGCVRSLPLRRVVPYSPSYSEEGATLEAESGPRDRANGRNVSVYDLGPRAHGRARGAIFGELWEEREGMVVSRGVSMPLRPDAFSWSLEKGTATLRPPAPLTGSAHFVRHGNNGHGTWTGSLSMPILGGEPVELAGSEFRAFLHQGVPQDE